MRKRVYLFRCDGRRCKGHFISSHGDPKKAIEEAKKRGWMVNEPKDLWGNTILTSHYCPKCHKGIKEIDREMSENRSSRKPEVE